MSSNRRTAKPSRLSADVPLRIELPAPDYQVFVFAARKLRRIMGRHAPDPKSLVCFNLSGRDATGVADHYLEVRRWPVTVRETIALRRPAIKRRRLSRLPGTKMDILSSRIPPLKDPTRN